MKIIDFMESFSFKAPVIWSHRPDADVGIFLIEDEQYEILIEYFESDATLRSTGRKFDTVAQVAFERIKDGKRFITKTDSKFSSRVLGAVYNGILSKIDLNGLDVIIFSAKKITGDSNENFNRRTHLYERIAKMMHARIPFAYVDRIFENDQGAHFILVRTDLKIADTEIEDLLKERYD